MQTRTGLPQWDTSALNRVNLVAEEASGDEWTKVKSKTSSLRSETILTGAAPWDEVWGGGAPDDVSAGGKVYHLMTTSDAERTYCFNECCATIDETLIVQNGSSHTKLLIWLVGSKHWTLWKSVAWLCTTGTVDQSTVLFALKRWWGTQKLLL